MKQIIKSTLHKLNDFPLVSMKMKNALICVFFLAIVLVGDIYFDDYQTELSVDAYLWFQEQSQFILDAALLLQYSLIAVQIFLLYLYMKWNRKLDGLLLIIFTSIGMGTNFLLKEAFNQGRPYMINDQIQATSCETSLAKPSGHSMGIVLYMLSIYQIEFYNFQVVSFKWIKIITYGLIILTVGLSRLIIGVHTISQILMGFVFGIAFFVLYTSYIHEKLRQIILKHIFRRAKYTFRLANLIFALFIIFLTVPLAVDHYSKIYFQNHPEVYQQYFDAVQSCRERNNLEPLPDDALILQYPTINGYSFYFTSIGILLGFLIFQGYYEEGIYEAVKSTRTFMVRLIRFLFLVVPQYFWISFTVDRQDLDFYWFYFGKIVLCSIINGMYYTAIFPLLMNMLKLEIHGDIQCCEKQNLIAEYSKILLSDSSIEE
ncbi:hypothetical protein pb186bvf_012799 [Paramecium bursaria]